MDSLQPEIELPGVPSHLLPEAKKEYRRIKDELVRYGLVSKIDRAALCLYLSSWAELVYAEKMLARKMKAAQMKMAEAEAAGQEYTGGDGMTEVTTNGNVIYSPWWVIANKMRGQVDKFLSNFGMSPSSRGRVSPSNYLQRDLFDDVEGKTAGGFGAI
jgi:P27 family predicted phage terminase small subunit